MCGSVAYRSSHCRVPTQQKHHISKISLGSSKLFWARHFFNNICIHKYYIYCYKEFSIIKVNKKLDFLTLYLNNKSKQFIFIGRTLLQLFCVCKFIIVWYILFTDTM